MKTVQKGKQKTLFSILPEQHFTPNSLTPEAGFFNSVIPCAILVDANSTLFDDDRIL